MLAERDERRVEVVVQWHAEGENTRLSDFLNSPIDFVTARTGFGTLIVNKHRIRETRITQPVARGTASGDARPRLAASTPPSLGAGPFDPASGR